MKDARITYFIHQNSWRICNRIQRYLGRRDIMYKVYAGNSGLTSLARALTENENSIVDVIRFELNKAILK